MQSDGVKKLSIMEKIGYSMGDSAANFIFQTTIIFQMVYFTTVLGLSPVKTGTLLFVAMVWGAICDPIMGVLADKTTSRWGKFRPWILWSIVPFGVIYFLVYLTPDISEGGKLAYAYITYLLMWTIYSINNLPYSALGGVMTGNVVERTSIASYRQVAGMGAAFVIQGFFMSLVTYFSHTPDGGVSAAQGWRITVAIFAVIAMAFHLITFITTRERIVPKKEVEASTKEAFSDLLRNGPWIAIFLATLFIFTNLSLRGGVLYFYFDHYLNPDSLLQFLNWFGFNPEPAAIVSRSFELFNMSGMAIQILGIVLSKTISERFGKRNTFITAMIFATFFCGLFVIVTPDTPWIAYLINIGQTFAFGITIPLLWAMIADVADFQEWKFNRRATGVVFAGVVFALKFGLGAGGFANGLLLDSYGFEAENIVESAVQGIRLTASIFPASMFVLAIICLFFYSISKSKELQIQDELAARRK